MSVNDVSVSIVLYNNAKTIKACLESLPPNTPLYILDNASKDNGAEIAKSVAPHAHIIRLEKNIGFGCGHNMLLRQVQTPFALLVNPDAVLTPNTIVRLRKTADEMPKAAIIAPISINDKGEAEPRVTSSEPQIVEGVSGAMPFLRLSAFEGIYFDERIFLYYEDNDLCLQARKKGWDVVIEPRTHFFHAASHSTSSSYKGIWFRGYHMGWSGTYLADKVDDFKGNAGKTYAKKTMARRFKHMVLKTLTLNFSKAVLYYGIICGSKAYCNAEKRIDSF